MTNNKNNKKEGQLKLAVLIDADNAQPCIIEGLLAEVAKYGVAIVKRMYGDFTSTNLNSWKKILLDYSISPMQQFPYTKGKNATDSFMIIDAMDLMHTGRFDGMCLVSSDSDFTRLAQRLREEGLTVYGFGEKKTPAPFVKACDKFIYTGILRPEKDTALLTTSLENKPTKDKPKTKDLPKEKVASKISNAESSKTTSLDAPLDLFHQAVEGASDEEGWAEMGQVALYLNKVKTDFDPRLYGSKKLSTLFRKHPKEFLIEDRVHENTNAHFVYVKSLGR